jgi:hypothetical protein
VNDRVRNVHWTFVLALSVVVLWATPVWAHQPFFESQDITAEDPWPIEDPSVSTAVYATLETARDVDYYVFDGEAGQTVLVSLTIPQVEGQEDFAPTLALIGPGLPQTPLPASVARPEGGALLFSPAPGPAETFFEPFSRTSYWERQEERVHLTAAGRYTVAVWHPEGEVGRYVFVVGDRELPGGDPAFALKMRDYWTPVGSTRRVRWTWWLLSLGLGLGLMIGATFVAVWLVRRARRAR